MNILASGLTGLVVVWSMMIIIWQLIERDGRQRIKNHPILGLPESEPVPLSKIINKYGRIKRRDDENNNNPGERVGLKPKN